MAAIKIFHLYPDHLNLYGDRGNMLALCRRALWRGIEVDVIPVNPGEKIDFKQCDLLFMGGGQDSDQAMVASDLNERKDDLQETVEAGMVLFAVCGSYQLLGRYYDTASGERLSGLSIMDHHTEAGAKRAIGNAVIECSLFAPPKTLVGFENHAGKTFLGSALKPLGKVVTGFGNNGQDRTEGAVYKNAIGTYLHGALLPKNPWLTDYLLEKALAYRNRDPVLKPLDNSMEIAAHRAAIDLAQSKRHSRLSSRA